MNGICYSTRYKELLLKYLAMILPPYFSLLKLGWFFTVQKSNVAQIVAQTTPVKTQNPDNQ